jgi:hypothetical protein
LGANFPHVYNPAILQAIKPSGPAGHAGMHSSSQVLSGQGGSHVKRKETWLPLMVAAATITGALVLGTNGAQAGSCTNSNLSDCSATCGGSANIASCTRDGSSVSCVCNETTKDVNGNAFGTATQDTSSGQGNLSDQPPSSDLTTSCTGNKGQCKQQ